MKRPTSASRALSLLFLLSALIAFLPGVPSAAETVKMHFFMSRECPHCKAERAFLIDLNQRYPELEIIPHVVTEIPADAELFVKMSQAYGEKIGGVPATFIGHFQPIIGFRDAATTGKLIEARVKYCSDTGCIDPMQRVRERFPAAAPAEPSDNRLLAGQQADGNAASPSRGNMANAEASSSEEPAPKLGLGSEIHFPLIGTVDASKMALPVLTVAIAGLDGFNPCAFFVLFTLLGMLVHVHSRGRMVLVGGIFVFFSGFIYFIFMAAWLNIFLLSGEIKAITFAAGAVALVIAVINIKDYFYFKQGVSLSIPDAAKPKLFDRMRKLLKASSLASIIAGTIVLAMAANAYELLCTAGFPMVFTRVLTLHKLSPATYYLYLVFYNVVYVIPLATIVAIFTITLGSKKLSEHQGQILKLVSGTMMLYLALVILIKPALLSNLGIAAGLLAAALATAGIIILLSKTKK